MSQHHPVEVTCPRCQSRGTYAAWSSVNRELSPDAAASLARGDLLEYRCAACGASTQVQYPVLLHAMTEGEMVQLAGAGERGPGGADGRMLSLLGERYVLWTVTDAADLIECARLYEAGLDRWAMLLFRAGLLVQGTKRGTPLHTIHFDALTEREGAPCMRFAVGSEGGEQGQMTVTRALWEAHLARVMPARDRCVARGRWTPWDLDTALAGLGSLAAPPS